MPQITALWACLSLYAACASSSAIELTIASDESHSDKWYVFLVVDEVA